MIAWHPINKASRPANVLPAPNPRTSLTPGRPTSNPHSIERILRHLGLARVAPKRAPPRPMPAGLPFSA